MDNKKLTWKRIILFYVIAFLPFAIITPVLCKVYSFWRGSNAENVEGSGIGLFEAGEIARKLGGDIFARTDENKGEMEFVTYLPQ